MANDKYYAWSEIRSDKGVINVGDEVTADSLGVDDKQFDVYVEEGVVRTQPYPEMDPLFTGSPDEWVKLEMGRLSRGEPTWASQQEESGSKKKEEKPAASGSGS